MEENKNEKGLSNLSPKKLQIKIKHSSGFGKTTEHSTYYKTSFPNNFSSINNTNNNINPSDYFLNYSLVKIIYQYTTNPNPNPNENKKKQESSNSNSNNNNSLIGMQCYYRKNTGQPSPSQIFFNIPPQSELKNFSEGELDFEKKEFIIKIRMFINDKLTGFEIITNKRRKKIGYCEEENSVDVNEINDEKKVVVGFCGFADKDEGITNLRCLYVDRNKIPMYKFSVGILELRNKLKNKKFRENVEKKMEKVNGNNKLKILKNTCLLPDNMFFGIAQFSVNDPIIINNNVNN